MFHFQLHGWTVARLTGYLDFGNLRLFSLDCLTQLLAPQLVTLPVHELVVVYSIISTELPKILGLAAQLVEVIYLLIVYFSFAIIIIVKGYGAKVGL